MDKIDIWFLNLLRLIVKIFQVQSMKIKIYCINFGFQAIYYSL